MNDFQEYLNFKLISSIINSDVFFDLLDSYNDVIFTEKFIICMSNFSERYIKTNKLYKEQVSRFRIFVEYIRNNNKLPLEKYELLFNDMIDSMNKTDFSNRSSYCVENYISRFKGHNFYRIYTHPHLIPDFIKKIKHSVSEDYFFLLLLTEFSEDEFNSSLEFALLNEYFLLSVNQIIAEFPQILKNETFIRRFKIIVKENLKRIDEIKNEKDKKIIFKESKYYDKHIKEE